MYMNFSRVVHVGRISSVSPVYEAAPAQWQYELLWGRACNLDHGSPGHTLLTEAGALPWADGHQSVPYHQVVLEALTVALPGGTASSSLHKHVYTC